MRYLTAVAALGLLLAVSGTAGAVTIDTVFVGNPGNAADSTGYGAVAYIYNIGKYEVTAGQYTAFLNAVATTDAYGLYNANMWSSTKGCKIEQSGSLNSYTYSVADDYANRPVNYVSWGDAARFANWLHNGHLTGAQDLTTTEGGSYNLNGAMTTLDLMAVTRQANATWVIPSEDEWYKAAYYDPSLNEGAGGYYDYPTGSDSIPSNDALGSPDPGNNANFYGFGSPFPGHAGYAIGSPEYRTEVGEFENSESPYGTFDQGGNVSEWNEAVYEWGTTTGRRYRGGSFDGLGMGYDVLDLRADDRAWAIPDCEGSYLGFRVALVPEPVTMAGLVLGIGSLVGYVRRRRR